MNDFSLIPFEEGLTEQKKAVSIGFFDGVHRGHRFVFDRLREEAQRHGAAPWAVTFDVHPLAVLAPGQQPPLLTTLDEKIAALRRCGLAGAIVLHFDRKMAGLTAEQFMRALGGLRSPIWPPAAGRWIRTISRNRRFHRHRCRTMPSPAERDHFVFAHPVAARSRRCARSRCRTRTTLRFDGNRGTWFPKWAENRLPHSEPRTAKCR